MIYAKVSEGSVLELIPRPNWFDDTGASVSDALLAENGVLPVRDVLPSFDPLVFTATQVDHKNWLVEVDHVAVVYDVQPIPEETIQRRRYNGVIAERERRLSHGFDYDFGDSRGVHRIGTTDIDMRRWADEVTPISQALINTGNPGSQIGITTDTGPAIITAMEWQQVLVAAGLWRQPIYQASFDLLAMNPIPADYADDSRWPSVSGEEG